MHYETDEEAQLAITKTNGTVLKDRKMAVGKFEPADRRHKEKWTNLFVKNIPSSWNKAKLRDVFSK